MNPYIPLLVLLVVCSGFVLSMLFVSSFFGPKNKTPTKQLPFECGSVSVGSVRDQRFNVRFYLVAMLFIIFDLEIAFLFPWAITLGNIGLFGFWSMMLFLGVLTIGFIYEWKKGALEWE